MFPLLQDCAVGLLFALLPVLGGASGIFGGVISMAKLYGYYQNSYVKIKSKFHYHIDACLCFSACLVHQ